MPPQKALEETKDNKLDTEEEERLDWLRHKITIREEREARENLASKKKKKKRVKIPTPVDDSMKDTNERYMARDGAYTYTTDGERLKVKFHDPTKVINPFCSTAVRAKISKPLVQETSQTGITLMSNPYSGKNSRETSLEKDSKKSKKKEMDITFHSRISMKGLFARAE